MPKQHHGWKGPVFGTALALVTGASFLGTGLAWAEKAGRDDVRERALDDARGQGSAQGYLSVAEIAARLSEDEVGQIREVEREGAVYEVEVYHPERGRTELEVDARTGEVLRRQADD